MTNIWIGQRVTTGKRTGTITEAFYQGDLLNIDDDVMMVNVLMDETNEIVLVPVDDTIIIGLEEIE